MDLLLALRTLALTLIGLGLIVGLVSPRMALRAVVRALVMPIVLLLAWSFAVQAWAALPVWARVLLFAGGVPVTLGGLLLSTRFGREVLASLVGNALYDLLRGGARPLLWLLLILTGAAVGVALLV